MKNRCISEGGRLISEVLNKGFLVTVDIEKAFGTVNHHFLIAILEGLSFEDEFIEWKKYY